MIDFEGLEEEAKRENILRYAILMSKTDGVLNPPEYSYLLQLANSLSYGEVNLQELILEEDSTLYVPVAEVERMEILYYIFNLIRADRTISQQEEELLYHFGLKLGFSPLLMNDIMDLLRKFLYEKLTKDAILIEVKKYLN